MTRFRSKSKSGGGGQRRFHLRCQLFRLSFFEWTHRRHRPNTSHDGSMSNLRRAIHGTRIGGNAL